MNGVDQLDELKDLSNWFKHIFLLGLLVTIWLVLTDSEDRSTEANNSENYNLNLIEILQIGGHKYVSSLSTKLTSLTSH